MNAPTFQRWIRGLWVLQREDIMVCPLKKVCVKEKGYIEWKNIGFAPKVMADQESVKRSISSRDL